MGDTLDPEPSATSGVSGAPESSDAPTSLSIGEVLAVLAEEFPDVTVSKIRFLESQGLVNPDRNASGYRQFDDADIERLRWILRQQRDKFLPLKVIKRALDSGVDVVDAGADQPTLWTAVADEEVDRLAREARADVDAEDDSESTTDNVADASEAAKSVGSHPAAKSAGTRSRHATPADVVAALQEDPRPEQAKTAPASRSADPARSESAQPASVASREPATQGRTYDRRELLESAGIPPETLDALGEFGLVAPVDVGGEANYDDADLLVCRAAARCAELGLGPRHLRIYKVSAVREAGLVEQLVMPLVKQRNPEARAEAERTAAELTQLGAEVHAALLGRELGPIAPQLR